MKMALLGGLGYLGSNLVSALSKTDLDLKIYVIDRTEIKSQKIEGCSNVHYIQCDINDSVSLKEILKSVDLVWLKAGLLGGSMSVNIDSLNDYLRANVDTLAGVLDNCNFVGCNNIVFDSSAQVFGESNSLTARRIDDPILPMNYYGVSKFICEKMLYAWAHKAGANKQETRSVQIFRYPRVRSTGSQDLLGKMVTRAIANKDIEIYGTGEKAFDYVDLDDVMKASIKVLSRNPNYQVYHLSCGESMKIIDLANYIIQRTGSNSKLIHVKNDQVEFEPMNIFLHDAATRKLLSLSTPISYKDMVDREIEYYLDKNPLI
jgi:UDP-glucose 4-epimerase